MKLIQPDRRPCSLSGSHGAPQGLIGSFFSRFLTTSAKDFLDFSPQASSRPAPPYQQQSSPQRSHHGIHHRHHWSSHFFHSNACILLILACALGVSLSSLNELLDPHQGVDHLMSTLTCDRQVSADHPSNCRHDSASRLARRFFFPCWCRCDCAC